VAAQRVRAGSTILAGAANLRRRCLDQAMTIHPDGPQVVSAHREIAAGAEPIFELIADPTEQPRWDGNNNLVASVEGRRVEALGEVFTMTTTKGNVRENHVVEFEEGRLMAWTPAAPGQQPWGHLWRWQLEPVDAGRTRVTHTYDWTNLTDETRFAKARSTTTDNLLASIDRLAALLDQV